MNYEKLSKVLCHILRHAPEQYGLDLDKHGFANIDDVISILSKQKKYSDLSKGHLEHLSQKSDKQRFEILDSKIRATYGHSIKVELGHVNCEPPEFLYHGTSMNFVYDIFNQGILQGKRQYVHMCETLQRAEEMGQRKDGDLLIIAICAKDAYKKGTEFYKGADQTWLTEYVPPQYLLLTNHSGAINKR